MGETVKLDVKNFVGANSSSNVKNANSTDSDSKNSFSDILKCAGNSNNSSKDMKSSQTNGEQTATVNGTADETSQKKSDLIQTKKTDNNSLQSDNEEDVQLTDEQKKELDKVKEILEKLMSGDKDSDNKIHAVLAKIARNLAASNSADTKKDAKLTDNIIETLLASMNINSTQFDQILNSGSQSDALSEIQQDLNKLINLVTNDKSTISDSFKQLDNNKDNTVKSSDLKLNQLLADSNSADEDKLLAKIKQELNSLAAELKQAGAEKKTDMSNKDSSPINIINISADKSKASEQNEDSKHQSDSNSGQDDKFLNDLLSGNNDGKDDKISKVSNLFSQFSADNTSKTTAAQAPIVTRSNFSADIVKSLKYMETNNIKDLTIKIMPKELGEVIIKITSDGGIMKASITAANKDAYNLLNSNLQDITKSFSNQDIKIQNVEINIYNGDTTFFSGNGNEENSSNGSKKNKNLGNFTLDEIDSVSEQDDVFDENNINALA